MNKWIITDEDDRQKFGLEFESEQEGEDYLNGFEYCFSGLYIVEIENEGI